MSSNQFLNPNQNSKRNHLNKITTTGMSDLDSFSEASKINSNAEDGMNVCKNIVRVRRVQKSIEQRRNKMMQNLKDKHLKM